MLKALLPSDMMIRPPGLSGAGFLAWSQHKLFYEMAYKHATEVFAEAREAGDPTMAALMAAVVTGLTASRAAGESQRAQEPARMMVSGTPCRRSMRLLLAAFPTKLSANRAASAPRSGRTTTTGSTSGPRPEACPTARPPDAGKDRR
jgi:hypothetical protein